MCTKAPQLAASTKLAKGKTQHSMHVLGINDLDPHESFYALRNMRNAVTRHVKEPDEKLRHIVRMIGGRLSFLSRVARVPDMEERVKSIVGHEKAWLQSQIGLIPDHDDDVMDDVRAPNRLQTVAIPLTHSRTFCSKNGRQAPGYCCKSLSRCSRRQKRSARRMGRLLLVNSHFRVFRTGGVELL